MRDPCRRLLAAACLLGASLAGGAACNDGFIDPVGPVGDATPTAADTTGSEVMGDAAPDAPPAEVVTGDGACTIELVWGGAPLAESVAAAGEWNQFSTTAAPMVRAGGAWRATLRLDPGEYGLRYAVNGALEGASPRDVPTHWVGGIEMRNLRVADCIRPRWEVGALALTIDASGRARGNLRYVAGKNGAELDPASVVLTLGTTAVVPAVAGDDVTFDLTLPAAAPGGAGGPGKYSLHARANDTAGTPLAPLWVPLWWEATPFDWRDALLYMLMPDRFRNADQRADPVVGDPALPDIANYLGGDFAGLEAAIREGFFETLGVNAIWLTPILQNAAGGWLGTDLIHHVAGYHGYWPIDAFAIEPRLGGKDALVAAIAAAHQRGIRIVLDVTLNDVHEQHPYCAAGLCKAGCVCGQGDCAWETHALDCQFAAYLPDLDFRDHRVVTRVADDVVQLVADLDIDGLRIDAVKHMDHVIMRAVRERLQAIEDARGAPFWLVGEAFVGGGERAFLLEYIGAAELHGLFDFPLFWTIRSVFAPGGGTPGTFRELEAASAASDATYGAANAWMSPFLGNHDVARMATAIANNDQGNFGATPDLLSGSGRWDIINPLSEAFAFTLTRPGIPLIYMGDEVGLAGSGDPDNRRMRPWTGLSADQSEMQRRVGELGVARRAHAALRTGARRELWVDDTLYVQARWLPAAAPGAGARVVLVAMVKGDAARSERVTAPPELGIEGKTLRSLWSSRTLTVTGGGFDLQINGWEYAIFAVEE
jgi:glycosidase